jgi:hypothetical protein
VLFFNDGDGVCNLFTPEMLASARLAPRAGKELGALLRDEVQGYLIAGSAVGGTLAGAAWAYLMGQIEDSLYGPERTIDLGNGHTITFRPGGGGPPHVD